MVYWKNSAEGLPDNTVVTAANSGGASGDPWSTIPSAGAITAKDGAALDGNRGFELTPVASTSKQWIWNFPTPTDIAQFSHKTRILSAPTAAHNLVQVRHGSGNALVVRNSLNSGNSRIELQDAAGATIWSTPAATLTPDTIYRFEGIVEPGATSSTGRVEFAIYAGNDLTPLASYSGSTHNFGSADLTNIRYGRPSPTTTDVTGAHWDSFQLWTDTDVPNELGQPWVTGAELPKIELTVTRLTYTSAELSWTMPEFAPDGVTIVRAPGIQTNDDQGREPSHALYDPSGLPGATILDEGVVASPWVDEGLSPGEWTYWLVRTGA